MKDNANFETNQHYESKISFNIRVRLCMFKKFTGKSCILLSITNSHAGLPIHQQNVIVQTGNPIIIK